MKLPKLQLKIGKFVARLGLAGVVILCIAIVTVIILPAPIADRLLQDDMTHRSEIWRDRVVGLLEAGDQAFVDGQISGRDKSRLDIFVSSSDVFRFKMFTSAGRVFHSSRTGDIGVLTTKPYFSGIVAKGDTYFKTAIKPFASIDHSGALENGEVYDPEADRLVAEIYAPVLVENRFVGAVEFYRDITETRAAFVTRLRFGFGVLAAIGVILSFTAVVMISHSGRARIREMRARAQDEKDMAEAQMRLGREVRLLSDLNEWLQSSRSLDELFDMVSMFMSRLIPDCSGTIYVYSNSRDVLDGACSWNGGALEDHIRPESCWGLRRGRSYAYGTSEIDFVCDHINDHDGRPYFCFPVLAHGETVGLMTVITDYKMTDAGRHAARKLAQMCAEQISLAIANVRMRDQLHHQSIRDPLTGLYNRRHFIEQLRLAIDDAKRKTGAVSLISIDVDHFKNFNDNHGHDAGDMVLRAVGSTLEDMCDGDHLACRMGGEEFVALLPLTDSTQAMQMAETLRLAVEAISVRYGEKTLPRISISLGVASFPQHGMMPQDLINKADDALYAAKAAGRNQVCLAGQDAGEPPAPKEKAVRSAPKKRATENDRKRAARGKAKRTVQDKPAITPSKANSVVPLIAARSIAETAKTVDSPETAQAKQQKK